MTKTASLNTSTTIDIVDYPTPSPRCSLDFCIHMADGTLVGDNLLRLESFNGGSKVSQPFDYQLDLRADDNRSDTEPGLLETATCTLSLKNILGRPATISMQLPTSEDANNSPPDSYINGVISSFSMVEAGHYQARLKPALWRLSLANNYQLYSNMTIKDILYAIVKDKHQIECDLEGLEGVAIARTQDWLQAGESDFDFISRLMNKVSIYYYFVHSFGLHKILFANKACYRKLNQRLPNGSLTALPLTLYYTFSKVQSLQENDLIEDFSYRQDLTTSRVHSLIAEPHAAWEKNETATYNRFGSTTLETTDQVISDSETFNQYQIYQYGSKKDEAIDFAQLEMDKLQTSAAEISGKTACRELKPGYQFATEQHKSVADDKHWRPSVLEMRPDFNRQAFVVTSVNESVQASGDYQCQFLATLADGQIAPFGLHNTHMGSLLAVVSCAPDDKESPSKYLHYLEKKNFSHYSNHFNSEFTGQYRAQGVYVKFTTNSPDADATWVKLAEHMQTVPEVGVTVLVSRSNDESEIPEIQSIIQSKGNHVINPNGATDNTNWGDNYSTSYGDSHGIRYGKKSAVDLAEARKIISDQYQTGQFKDVSYSKGGSFSHSVSDNGIEGMLSTSYSEGCTYSTFNGATTENHSTIGSSTSYSTIDDSYSESTIGTSTSDSTIDTTINNSTIDTSTSDSDIGTSTSTSNIGTSTNTSTITTSTNTNTITTSTNNSTIGTSNNTSTTNINNNMSATGISNNISATGLVTSLSATGASASVSATGASASASATGASASANFVGASASVNVVLAEASVSFGLSGTRLVKKPSLETQISEGIKAQLKNTDVAIVGAIKATL